LAHIFASKARHDLAQRKLPFIAPDQEAFHDPGRCWRKFIGGKSGVRSFLNVRAKITSYCQEVAMS
jgi:hypothetical protein